MAGKRVPAEAAYMVRIQLPPGMTPEQARVELQHSIGFGHPEVALMYLEYLDVPQS